MSKPATLLFLLMILGIGVTGTYAQVAINRQVIPWKECDERAPVPPLVKDLQPQGSERIKKWITCLGSRDNEVSVGRDGCWQDHSCDLMLVIHPEVKVNNKYYVYFLIYAAIQTPPGQHQSEEEVSWIQMFFARKRMQELIMDPSYTPIAEVIYVNGQVEPKLRVYFNTATEHEIEIKGADDTGKRSTGPMTPVPELTTRITNSEVRDNATKTYQRFVFRTPSLMLTTFTNHTQYRVDLYIDRIWPYVIQYLETVQTDGRPLNGSLERKPQLTGNIIRLGDPEGAVLLMPPSPENLFTGNITVPRTRFPQKNWSQQLKPTTRNPNGKSASSPLIVGIVVAVIVVLLLAAVLIRYFYFRPRGSSSDHSNWIKKVNSTDGVHKRIGFDDLKYNRSTMDGQSMVMMSSHATPVPLTKSPEKKSNKKAHETKAVYKNRKN